MTVNPEHLEIILRRLSEGDSLRMLCRDERARDPTFPAEATVRLEVRRNERFAAEYEQARTLGYEALADEILEIADDARGDWIETEDGTRLFNKESVARARLRFDARRWLLSKCLPKVYGDRIEVARVIDPRIREMSDDELRQAIMDEFNRLARVCRAAPLAALPAPSEEGEG